MITFAQHLNEVKVYDVIKADYRYVDVYRVLTRTSLQAVINQHDCVRAIWKDGYLYCWNGFRALHMNFELKFGEGTVNLEINTERGRTIVAVTKGRVDDQRLKMILRDLQVVPAVWS